MSECTADTVHQLMEAVRTLQERVEQQEAELLRLRRHRVPSGEQSQAVGGPSPASLGLSRAALLKTAGIGIASAVAVVKIAGSTDEALASTGDSVAAGRITKAENGTMVTYDGAAGLGTAVLAGNDSTYGNEGTYDYPAAVVGLAGAGSSAGTGGLVNGVHGFTDNGAGNGVIGLNTNHVDGAGNGVLGVASRLGSYGVQGTNSDGTGVLGLASNPAGSIAGVLGHHTGASGGIGVFGQQDGDGFGGYFVSANRHGAVGQASNPNNNASGVVGHHTGTEGGIGVFGTQDGAGFGGHFI